MPGAPIDLTGKVAIVTGGSRGIGAAIAKGLAAYGAKLTILDLAERREDAAKTVQAIEQDGGIAQALEADVRDPESIASAVSATTNHFGKLDIMVNNAGVSIREPALEMSKEQWDAVHDVNLRGIFFGCQLAAREMIKGGGGKIVNTASELAFVAPRSGTLASYIASKGGVVSLTRALAVEWAEHKINVNALAPGPTNTEMIADRLADPVFYQTHIAEVPLARVMEPDDMVGAVAFLSSDLSNMVTGQVILVDGGRALT